MPNWPTLLKRKVHPNASSLLWDSGVVLIVLGIPVLLVFAFLDQSLVNEEPRWIKPLKFFSSIALYNFTLEWIYRIYQSDQTVRALNRIRAIIGIGMLVEVSLITIQAARGVQSHFNTATPLDNLIFNAMGIIITIVVLTALVSIYFVWKGRRSAPRILSEAIVFGIILMTVASFQGFAMTVPTPQQIETLRAGMPLTISGSHFSGEPPENHQKIPFLGWSTQIGDLRIPHFIGLHAIQVFIVIAFMLHNLKFSSPHIWMRGVVAVYSAFFVYLLFHALSGRFIA